MPYCLVYSDGLDSISTQFSASVSEEIPTPTDTVPGMRTIIIGAGSVGLWTALYLANARIEAGECFGAITVIDNNTSVFGATSGACTGCIHYKFAGLDDLSELGEYSFNLWKEFAQDTSFKEAVGWREGSIFGVDEGSGQQQSLLPDWLRANPNWNIDASFLGPRNAMVNPAGVGRWLQEQCEKAGIQIITSTTAVAAHLDLNNEIVAVTCKDVEGTFTLKCASLVVAAGPWTPEVYKELFPSSTITPELKIDPGDWIVFKNPCVVSQKSIAFVGLNDIVGEKLEFAGRDDGTIWVCGKREGIGQLPPIGESSIATPEVISKLTGRSYRFLRGQFPQDPDRFEELEIAKLGRAFRPSTPSGMPVISPVPTTHLSERQQNLGNERCAEGRVFLCWGHGAYGLTLGPGTGKIMAQIMLGEKPDVDVSPFTLPEERSANVES